MTRSMPQIVLFVCQTLLHLKRSFWHPAQVAMFSMKAVWLAGCVQLRHVPCVGSLWVPRPQGAQRRELLTARAALVPGPKGWNFHLLSRAEAEWRISGPK
mmetsp:Transcript_10997/g.18110  ORF Transcript_10997/g.18110 Transcript_10997/m.18110 type:complete len:100 (-) Transcript_10997:15-314(-)